VAALSPGYDPYLCDAKGTMMTNDYWKQIGWQFCVFVLVATNVKRTQKTFHPKFSPYLATAAFEGWSHAGVREGLEQSEIKIYMYIIYIYILYIYFFICIHTSTTLFLCQFILPSWPPPF
jgi:hypothetical protein